MFKKSFFSFLGAILLLSACNSSQVPDQETPAAQAEKPTVIASFYPLAYLAEQIAGENAEVINLIPGGGEPHDYEPSPQQLIAMESADLILIQGGGLEPWAEELEEKKAPFPRVSLLNMSSRLKLELLEEEDHHEEDHEEDEGHEDEADHEHGLYDPHTWLDPLLMIEMGKAIENDLIQIDFDHAEEYKANAQELYASLEALDREFRNALAYCPLRTFITSHEAFGYLARRYHLEPIGISGLSPEDEPSAKRLAELAQMAKEKGISHVFLESSANPEISQTLAQEAGLTSLSLHSLESAPGDEGDYLSVMRNNLENLKTGLKCQ